MRLKLIIYTVVKIMFHCFGHEPEKTVAMPISGTFNRQFLRRMDSEPTINRKGFLKRAGLAIAGAFVVSSAAHTTSRGQAQTATQGASSSTPTSAMARIRTAKGAVARKA